MTGSTWRRRIRSADLAASPKYLARAFAVLACVVVLGMTGMRLYADREQVLHDAELSTANLARSVSEHARSTFQVADLMLSGLVERLQADGTSAAAMKRLDQYMASRVAAIPEIHDLLLFAADGHWFGGSTPANPAMGVSDRPFFHHHHDDPDPGPFLGAPVPGKLTGRWSITVSRRFNDARGEFAGVVVAVVEVQTFEAFYRNFDLGPHGIIALLKDDGTMMARMPQRSEFLGTNQRQADAFVAYRQAGPVGSVRSFSVIDKREIFLSFRTVDAFSLVLFVALAEEDILAPWRRSVILWLVASTGVATALALLGWRLAHQISLHARTEAALQQSQRLLTTYVDHLADGVLGVRAYPDGRFVYEWANAAAYEHLELPAEIEGREPRQVLATGLAEQVEARVRAAIEAGGVLRNRWVIEAAASRTGRRRVVDILRTPVRDREDGSVLVLSSMRDITRELEVEAQLVQAQRLEAVGQLTAGVAHDFNNLLQSQIAALELLIDAVEDQERPLELAEMAIGIAESGAKLTHSLLAFSRKQILQPQSVDLAALLARIEDMLKRTLNPRINLQVSMATPLAAPVADAAQLEAALLNLCLNGRDAMEDHGGRLLVEAHSEPAAAAGDPECGWVVLAISDEGRGMDAETIARACEPFFTTKSVGKGSGLGLSMVQGFARQSQGELRIDSRPGEGTRVELRLPAAAAAAPAADDVKRPALADGPRVVRRVLLVDDEPAIRDVLGQTLQAAGYVVTQAADAEEAFALLREDLGFDVLVTDYAMPGMTGGELVTIARRMDPDMPALIVTGYADKSELNDIPAEIEILHKPVRTNVLVGKLETLLGARPPHRPSLPRMPVQALV